MTKQTMLIIEDDPALQDFLRDLLVEHGYESYTVARGIDGLKRAKSLQPDTILLDLTLPDITGIEVSNN